MSWGGLHPSPCPVLSLPRPHTAVGTQVRDALPAHLIYVVLLHLFLPFSVFGEASAPRPSSAQGPKVPRALGMPGCLGLGLSWGGEAPVKAGERPGACGWGRGCVRGRGPGPRL